MDTIINQDRLERRCVALREYIKNDLYSFTTLNEKQIEIIADSLTNQLRTYISFAQETVEKE